jgi:hypothetical protein
MKNTANRENEEKPQEQRVRQFTSVLKEHGEGEKSYSRLKTDYVCTYISKITCKQKLNFFTKEKNIYTVSEIVSSKNKAFFQQSTSNYVIVD